MFHSQLVLVIQQQQGLWLLRRTIEANRHHMVVRSSVPVLKAGECSRSQSSGMLLQAIYSKIRQSLLTSVKMLPSGQLLFSGLAWNRLLNYTCYLGDNVNTTLEDASLAITKFNFLYRRGEKTTRSSASWMNAALHP